MATSLTIPGLVPPPRTNLPQTLVPAMSGAFSGDVQTSATSSQAPRVSPLGVPVEIPTAVAASTPPPSQLQIGAGLGPPGWAPPTFVAGEHENFNPLVLFYANRDGSPGSVRHARPAMIVGKSLAAGHVHLSVFADPTIDHVGPLFMERDVPLIAAPDEREVLLDSMPQGSRLAIGLVFQAPAGDSAKPKLPDERVAGVHVPIEIEEAGLELKPKGPKGTPKKAKATRKSRARLRTVPIAPSQDA